MDDPATISVAFTAPVFTDILQVIQDIRNEARERGDRLEARIQAIEARLPVAPLDAILLPDLGNLSPIHITNHDSAPSESPINKISPSRSEIIQDASIQCVDEALITVPDLGDLSPMHITNHDNTPSESPTDDISPSRSENIQDASIQCVDVALTTVPEPTPAQASQLSEPVFAPLLPSPIQQKIVAAPRPRAARPSNLSELGKKRKRPVSSDDAEPGRAPVSVPGFQMRTSEAQIREIKREASAQSRELTPNDPPARSESPFDMRDAKRQPTLDGLDFPPPLRPQAQTRLQTDMSPPRADLPRPRTAPVQAAQVTQNTSEAEGLLDISQHGRIRKTTKRQPGFVDLPTDKELIRGSRRTRRGR